MSIQYQNAPSQRLLSLLRNPKMNKYTSDYVVSLLSQNSLMKIQQFMRKNKYLKVTGFLRFFRELLPFSKQETSQEDQFFLCFALFKLFQEICNTRKKVQVNFSDISTYIAEKMPNFTQQNIIQQKLLPLGLNIDQSHKQHINPPQIYGQILQDRVFLTLRPTKSDRIQHLSRDVGQSQYSKKFGLYFSIDKPSDKIHIYDDNFNQVQYLRTEQQITKRDMIVNYIAWSDSEEKIACILGNYSISMWSKEDNYKYEVNVPLPGQYLSHPYIIIKYLQCMRRWITLDNRPAIYVLDSKNYQPQYTFMNNKIRKQKQSQKIQLVQLNYVNLLGIGFERSMFLVSLKNKEIVSEVHNFTTAITSIAFSQSYQALFISTYEKYFRSYELSQYQDLMERGTFEGHKSQISLLGVIQEKPIVFSLQQNSILKMFDMRNYACYQSFSVLKNILYKQVLYLNNAICLVGSKMHVYSIQKQVVYKQKQSILYIGTLHKDLLVVSNKNIKVYNIRNGALVTVIKAVFGDKQQADIYSIFVMHNKQKLMIMSEEGKCVILETREMSQVQTWKFQPKPSYMHYDQQNQLLTQTSLGVLTISQYKNQHCQLQPRRVIHSPTDIIRYVKISVPHDLILLCFQNDQNLYFYSYEKGKMLGYLYFGQRKTVRYGNVYRGIKVIWRVIGVQFLAGKNCILVGLDDQVWVITYKMSFSSMSFMLKKQIKIWENPLTLLQPSRSPQAQEPTTYIYNQKQQQQPLHSTSIHLFQAQSTLVITSNKANIACFIQLQLNKIQGLQTVRINKQNYNPSRIGNEVHLGTLDHKNPMIVIRDIGTFGSVIAYSVYGASNGKIKLTGFVRGDKIGNLLAIADDKMNVTILQSPNWSQISGSLNFQQTLPNQWLIFKHSAQQLNQIQFLLSFLANQSQLPNPYQIKSLIEENPHIQLHMGKDPSLSNITISQLVKQDRMKGGFKTYRSCSLREKKMVLEKDREEKAKIENWVNQQKEIRKQKPDNTNKNNQIKQINQTLGYLSFNHNQTILKRGLIQLDMPAVRALQKKLNASINKQQKKSLISYKTGQQSTKTKKINQIANPPAMPSNELKLSKTLSTQVYQNMTQKIGLKRYNSRQLIQKLDFHKFKSQRKLKIQTLGRQSLPKI